MNREFSPIQSALNAFAEGKFVILQDDESRENEGDFVLAADFITADKINFLTHYARGLICTPITHELALKLDLPPMVPQNTSVHHTAFTISIDAKDNITTGISSFDRSHTIHLMVQEETEPTDFVRPGHIFPLIAHEKGLEERQGHTEASLEMCQMIGANPVAVICEIINPDGSMARGDDLFKLAEDFSLPIIHIQQLMEYKKSLPKTEAKNKSEKPLD